MSTKEKWSSILSRRKTEKNADSEENTKFARVLGFVDLTALGVGGTLGLGVYVLAGSVASTDAGPAVTISFLIAAIASAFAGLCYAEFASRVPKAGSAYIYCYVTIGEFAAFVIGWNLILEYAIGTASVAKGLSNYLDVMFHNALQKSFRNIFPMNISFLAPYPDFFAFAIVVALSLLLCWGVRESSTVNSVFTVMNLLTVITVIIAGAFKAKPSLWSIPKQSIPANVEGGEGGFLPFGWSGVMAGAAKCFYGFVGFDIIATTGEEAKNPKRNVPLAIVASLVIIFLAYFGVASVLTMMIPYYSQDKNTPLPYAFEQANLPFVTRIVTGGAVCALCASMLGASFPLPRILYAMAEDGLLFKFFSYVNPRTKTPVFATILSGLLAGFVASIFELSQLIDMMSIGTLLAYTIVALCILILRYQSDEEIFKQPSISFQNSPPKPQTHKSAILETFSVVFNLTRSKYPTSSSQTAVKYSILAFSVFMSLLCFTIIYAEKVLNELNIYLYVVSILIVLCFLSFLILIRQPQTKSRAPFQVSFVPLIPCCSITMNVYLMLKLDLNTWIRFIIWLLIGLIVYIYYAVDHSVQGIHNRLTLQNQNQMKVKQTESSREMIK